MLVVGALVHVVAAETAPKKFALLIANANYPDSVGVLRQPYSDVNRVRDALQAADVAVTLVQDRSIDQMEADLLAFTSKLSKAGPDALAFFYYAGHGAADGEGLDGKNYLIPVGQEFKTRLALTRQALAVETVIAEIKKSKVKASVVVIDACRNLAFERSVGGSGRGLAAQAQVQDMLIVFATSPGKTAEDSGIFGATLGEELQRSGEATAILKEVQRKVAERTGNSQVPEIRDQILSRNVCIRDCGKSAKEPQIQFYDPLIAEAAYWRDCCTGIMEKRVEGFLRYLESVRKSVFPGLFKEVAEQKLAKLKAAPTVVAQRGIVSEPPATEAYRRGKVLGALSDAPWVGVLTFKQISPKGTTETDDDGVLVGCGAVAIAPQWALMSALCSGENVDPAATYESQVIFDVEKIRDVRDRNIYKIEKIIYHPKFSKNWRTGRQGPLYDIALIKLARPRVGPVAPLALKAEAFPVGGLVAAYGFGTSEAKQLLVEGYNESLGRYQVGSERLKAAFMPLTSNALCKEAWASRSGDMLSSIDEHVVCAGYLNGGADTCNGDTGGPLVAWSDEKPFVIGVTSWGQSDCFSKGPPGVYIRITAFADWIRTTTGVSILEQEDLSGEKATPKPLDRDTSGAR